GVDVLKKIRGESALQQLPVIVFSNTFLSNMVQEAWKAGATKCLSKANCTPKQVIDVVRGLLQNAPASAGAAQPKAVVADNKPSSLETAADAAFQLELAKTFVASLPASLGSMRTALQALAKSADEAARVQNLQ